MKKKKPMKGKSKCSVYGNAAIRTRAQGHSSPTEPPTEKQPAELPTATLYYTRHALPLSFQRWRSPIAFSPGKWCSLNRTSVSRQERRRIFPYKWITLPCSNAWSQAGNLC